jgi:hypothetical protein
VVAPDVTQAHGITTQLPAGTTRRVYWRVSWTHWPHSRDEPTNMTRPYADEGLARAHLEGLQSMLADHPMDGPCHLHIWRPSLDRRVVWEGPWAAAGPPTPSMEDDP